MSFKKNQKAYNKQIIQTGKEANQYMRNALGLINQYTTDYSGRTDFWTNKLNDRQLNLLSDKYLQQNANMLRGSAAFGSNSKLNQQINENAYEQQNYLANVANQNIKDANTLQNNELQALFGAKQAYENPIAMGERAAQNVDAINWSWLNAVGKGMQSVGAVGMNSGIPWMQVIGAAVNQTGGTITALTSETTSLTPQQEMAAYNKGGFMFDKFAEASKGSNLSTGSESSSTLGGSSLFGALQGATKSNINIPTSIGSFGN